MASERTEQGHGDAPPVGPGPVVFHDDYELSILMEPDGTLRRVMHIHGVEGADFVELGRRSVVENARLAVDGEARAAEWEARLHLLRTEMRPIRYRTVPPGAQPGQPETVFCTATPIPAADGSLDSILLQTEDRSTALRVESELRTSEATAHDHQQQLRVALAVTGLGRYTLNIRDEVATGDARLSEIFGVDVPELLRNGGLAAWFDRIHVEDVDHVRHAIESAVAGGPDFDVEYRLWRQTGPDPAARELRWVAARGRLEFDDGTPVRMLGVIEDITERRAEEAARLRWQKREAIGTLAGGVAHDFNNVVSAILSNADLAEVELRRGVSPATSIAEIKQGAERASAIVQRLLAFSREDKPEEHSRLPFDLGAVAREACSLVSPSLPGGVTVQCSVAAALPPVVGSPTDVHRVLVNLLTNAGHAMEGRAGTIDVGVDTVTVPGSTGPTDGVRVRVSDAGPGISDRLLVRIFDPFFTTKPAGKGTGLGLSAARTIIHDHGGSLFAENLPRETGARFTVVLPTAASAPPAPSSVPPTHRAGSGPAPATGLRVVFVDDEAPLVMLAERALPAYGHAVLAFKDPVAALQVITADPQAVDALVTDLSMPSMSGLNLVEAVRRMRPGIPVVLSSGFLTAANRQEADRLGVDAIVPKPCSMDDLAQALARVAAGRTPA